MKERLIVAAVGIPILVLLLMVAPPIGTYLAVTFICVMSAYEFLRAVAVNTSANFRAFTILFAAVIPTITFGCHDVRDFQPIICGTAVLFASGVFADAIRRYDMGKIVHMGELFGSMFAGMMIPLFLSTLIDVRMSEYGYLYVMMPSFITMMSDTGGFFFGRRFGVTKAFPKVSPNKTYAGCIGGLVFAVIGAMLFGLMAYLVAKIRFRFWALTICGLIGSFASQLGDLAFSLIKRQSGIKDYGKIFPGHGGVLDRFDSTIFSAPVIFMAARIFDMI